MIHFRFFNIHFLCFLLILVLGCGAGGKMTSSKPSGRSGMIEDIDTFTLGDEFNITGQPPLRSSTYRQSDSQNNTGQSANERTGALNPRISSNQQASSAEPDTNTSGYRVQIDLFSDESDAHKYADRVRSKIDMNVYVSYEAPFFRVRTGNFSTKSEAENYVKYLKDKGFRKSMWIKTMINKR